MYLTFEQYKDMGGALNETAYIPLEYRAEKTIDHYTFGRLKNVDPVPDEVKYLVYELVGTLNISSGISAAIASETNDGTSIHYATKTTADLNAEYFTLVRAYLSGLVVDGVPVLYRGVYKDGKRRCCCNA